jgi:hypothetical protein
MEQFKQLISDFLLYISRKVTDKQIELSILKDIKELKFDSFDV